MTQHSLLGASSAYRWLQCPGSFHLSQTAPHRPSSIYAATGTLAHKLIEEAVRDQVTQVGPAELGRAWSQDEHIITIDQDLINGVNVMLDYLHRSAAGSDWKKVEFRIDLNDYFTRPPPVPMFGTVDAGVLGLLDQTLEVIDYKNGAGVIVDPVENPQLLYYAAGVLAQLPEHWRLQVENIKLTIVQPHALAAPIRSWDLNWIDLQMWVDEVLVPGVDACAQPDAPLNPGSWCRFCPVSHACPRLQQDAVAMARREFDDMPEADIDHPGTEDHFAEVLDIAERAQLWIDRVREFAVDQLKHQVRIPGWGLVPTRPTRKWVDEEEAITALQRGKVDHDTIFETRMRSPAQVEKVLTRTRSGRDVWDQVTPLIEAKSSGVKLARTTASAREDFTDEE